MDRIDFERVKTFSLPRKCEDKDNGRWLYGFGGTLEIGCERKFDSLLCRVLGWKDGMVSVKADGVPVVHVMPCTVFESLVRQLGERGCHIALRDGGPRKKSGMGFIYDALFGKRKDIVGKRKDIVGNTKSIVGERKSIVGNMREGEDCLTNDAFADTASGTGGPVVFDGLGRVCDAVEDVATTRHVMLELVKWFKSGELPLLIAEPLHDDDSNALLEVIVEYMRNGEYARKDSVDRKGEVE